MPPNPDVASLAAQASKAAAAQDKLRKAMAAVAAEVKAQPPAAAPAAGTK